MNRNPLMPFVLIAVIGIAAMFLMSFKGLGDMEEIAAQQEGGGEAATEETASANPEDWYTNNGCIGCHGGDYTGGVGPTLLGVGDKYSQDELVDILLNGIEGTTMPGGFPADQAPQMAEWLSTLQ